LTERNFDIFLLIERFFGNFSVRRERERELRVSSGVGEWCCPPPAVPFGGRLPFEPPLTFGG